MYIQSERNILYVDLQITSTFYWNVKEFTLCLSFHLSVIPLFHQIKSFYDPSLKGLPGASSNRIASPIVCLSVILSLI